MVPGILPSQLEILSMGQTYFEACCNVPNRNSLLALCCTARQYILSVRYVKPGSKDCSKSPADDMGFVDCVVQHSAERSEVGTQAYYVVENRANKGPAPAMFRKKWSRISAIPKNTSAALGKMPGSGDHSHLQCMERHSNCMWGYR